jgi:hypothetical protein
MGLFLGVKKTDIYLNKVAFFTVGWANDSIVWRRETSQDAGKLKAA